MERVYVFINAEPMRLWEIAKAATTIKGVKMADAVTGEFDVIVYAELDDTKELSGIIRQLQSINGVIRTHTSIVISYVSSPLF